MSPDWMSEALILAQKAASEDEVPVGAVIIHAGQIVGRGYNLRETLNLPTAHAEIRAIEDAAKNLKSWRLNDAILYVTLEPCPMCLAASQQARIGKIIYGATDPKGGALTLGYRLHEDVRTNHRFAVEHENHAACSQILSDFFAKKRKNLSSPD